MKFLKVKPLKIYLYSKKTRLNHPTAYLFLKSTQVNRWLLKDYEKGYKSLENNRGVQVVPF